MSSVSARAARPQRPLGFVVYQGPSMLDGKPIVVVATGFARASENPKTGNMVQTWILRRDVAPFAAIHSGADASICGACPLRGILERSQRGTINRRRACYVSVHQSPTAVFSAWKRGRHVPFDRSDLALFRGRMVRIGSYGDPCAVPYAVWSTIASAADGRTGYTHQWRDGRFWRFRRLVMARVETPEDAREARARGWRTFRSAPDALPVRGEFACPASAEQGHRLTCEQCGACNGANGRPERASVVIAAHGSPAVLSSYRRTFD